MHLAKNFQTIRKNSQQIRLQYLGNQKKNNIREVEIKFREVETTHR